MNRRLASSASQKKTSPLGFFASSMLSAAAPPAPARALCPVAIATRIVRARFPSRVPVSRAGGRGGGGGARRAERGAWRAHRHLARGRRRGGGKLATPRGAPRRAPAPAARRPPPADRPARFRAQTRRQSLKIPRLNARHPAGGGGQRDLSRTERPTFRLRRGGGGTESSARPRAQGGPQSGQDAPKCPRPASFGPLARQQARARGRASARGLGVGRRGGGGRRTSPAPPCPCKRPLGSSARSARQQTHVHTNTLIPGRAF